jgi:hypothetical protein
MTKKFDSALKWPLMLTFTRFFLALLFQFLLTFLLVYLKNPTPLKSAGKWFTVYGTLIDIVCLILIYRQINKEGKTFKDLINIDSKHIIKSELTGLGYTLFLFPISIAGTILSAFLIYGTFNAQQIMGGIPLWGAIYSVAIFPIEWAFSEQMTYQGYCLPHLEKAFNSKWLAIVIISFGWMLQHVALPFTPDWKYALMRMISFLPLTIIMPVMYLRTKRLLPFILCHWFMDFVAAVMAFPGLTK